jgi:hypothetical protein
MKDSDHQGYKAVRQISINVKGFKSSKVCSLDTMELNWKPVTKIPGKFLKTWKLNNILINNIWVKKNKREIMKCSYVNTCRNTTYSCEMPLKQNVRGKFIQKMPLFL